MGRLAGQHLPGFIERGFQLGKRRAGTHGDHQFGGVVADDAAVRAGVEHLPFDRTAEKGFAVAALDAQRRVGGERLVDLIQQLLAGVE